MEIRARIGAELDRLSNQLASGMSEELQGSLSGASPGGDIDRNQIQQRIGLLGQLVAALPFVEPGTVYPDRAGFGSTLRVRDLGSGEISEYVLMAGDFVDLDLGQVSLVSPLGQALLGSREGDQVTVPLPRGERRYEVVELRTLPSELGMSGNGDRPPPSPAPLQVA